MQRLDFKTYRPATRRKHLLVSILVTVEAWAPTAAAALGVGWAICLTAMSQVWAYPVPRALLASIASSCMFGAWAFAGIAVLFQTMPLNYRDPMSTRLSVLLVGVLGLMSVAVIHHGEYLVGAAFDLSQCASAVSVPICNKTATEIDTDPDLKAKLNALDQSLNSGSHVTTVVVWLMKLGR